MSALKIHTAPVFQPLLKPARYKAAWGGRWSAKTHFFAEGLVEECVAVPGTRAVCVRETQKSLKESSMQVIRDKVVQLELGGLFNPLKTEIGTPGGGVILFQGMQNHTAESIKSLEGCRIAWVDEAQALSERSLQLLRPTIRVPGSEIWFSWNPTRKSDAVDVLLRQKKVDNAIVVKSNWRDNPWFNAEGEAERLLELLHYPDRFDHTWEGGYAQAFAGAYFAALLGAARREGRIGRVSADPVLPRRAYFDIGLAGRFSDANAIWIVQFSGKQILVLDYIEGIGQPVGYYADLMRQKSYEGIELVLPHDGVKPDGIGKRYMDHWMEAGWENVTPIPNQGSGAALQRVEAVRRLLPRCWFNEKTTEDGRVALGFYHERRDDQRNIGLGPEHDWSSHAADAFGLMAICYEEPMVKARDRHRNRPGSRTSWVSL